MKVNYAEHVAQTPKKTVDVNILFDRIRNPKKEILDKINRARMFGKGSNQYDLIKKQLPCIYFNFLFDGNGMSDSNTTESTGLLYLDIDCVDDLSQLKKDLKQIPYLYAMWNSVSGKGISAIIKVDGLSVENFDEFVGFIKKNYKFNFDPSCFSRSRKTFISFDENIYVNDKCDKVSYSVILASNNSNIIKDKKRDIAITPNDTSNITPNDTLTRHYIRYNNKKDFQTDNVVEVYEDGVGVVEIQLNIKYKQGARHNGLLKDGIKFLFLNPQVDKLEDFKFHMHNLNRKKCNPMLPEKEIAVLSQQIFSKKGQYKPTTRKKKYIVNRDIVSNPRDVQKLVGKLVAEKRKESTLEFLKSLYQEGMTQKKLSQEAEMGIATIKRYWKQLNK